jgi:hypothetical protein
MGGAFLGAGITTGRSEAGAAGLGAAAGFSTAGGAAATGFSACLAGGPGGTVTTAGDFGFAAGGCCCSCSRWRSSFITSPGLEIFDRSILGLISDCAAFSLEAEPDRAEKYFLTFSASSSSTELEWVFFSVTPTSNNTSRMALLFTSSSLAKSFIRIFIRSVFPPGISATRSYRPHGFSIHAHCCARLSLTNLFRRIVPTPRLLFLP